MIYTSYFAKLRNLPWYYKPISICAKPPNGYSGLQYKKLAPTYSILMNYKKNLDKELYTERFEKEILDKLNPEDVVKELLTLAGNFKGVNYSPEIVLVCYEKPTDFCHRHLVADWLNEYGYDVQELNVNKS